MRTDVSVHRRLAPPLRNNGLPGQAPLPIFEAAFGGLGSQVPLAASSGFGNSTFITNLQQGEAGALANSLATSNIYLCRMVGSSFIPCGNLGYTVAGKYPMNFFRPNPFVNNINYLTDDANTNSRSYLRSVRRAVMTLSLLTDTGIARAWPMRDRSRR